MAARNKARPRIQLPVVGGTTTHELENGGRSVVGGYPLLPLSPSMTVGSLHATPAPLTPGLIIPGTAMVPGTATITDGVYQFYPSKASGFVFKQFRDVKDFTLNTAKSGLSVGEKTAFWLYNKFSNWSRKWFTHLFLFLVVFAYSLIGAAIFCYIEGRHEEMHLTDILRAKQRLLDKLEELASNFTNPGDLATRDHWRGEVIDHLNTYQDQLYISFSEANVMDNARKVWDFWNAVFYCVTIYTTIGYGHIAPSTNSGRAVTIIYAVFGIPLFLILLADFGKMFTRGMKFLWAFVRRLYYTGSCRKVRHTGPVQEVMKGVQLVYDIARFQRHPGEGPQVIGTPIQLQQQQDEEAPPTADSSLLPPGTIPAEPTTPAPSNFCVDDEFNLPISVAIAILVAYIFVGASIYCMWEEWSFFESFYFVFISMSTIGFGDYVPKHPMFLMASIVYLVFGLALTSMCINVVQVKLSDTFRQASAKIGASLGLRLTAVSAANTAVATPAVELAQVHLPSGPARKASEETLGDLSPSNDGQQSNSKQH